MSSRDNNDGTVFRIRGVIFDQGATLLFRTKKCDVSQQSNDLVQFLTDYFHWDEQQKNTFITQRKKTNADMKLRKDYIGTWTALDEGCMMEIPIEDTLIHTLEVMGCDTSAMDKSIVSRAIDLIRVPSECFELAKNAHSVLEQLCESGIRCALATNQYDADRQIDLLNTFNLKQYFDEIVVSANVRYRKPDCRILQPIFEKWKDMRREEVVVVGDKHTTDIMLAKYCNLRCIQFKSNSLKVEKEKPEKSFSLLNPDNYIERHGSYVVRPDAFSDAIPAKLGYHTPDRMITNLSDLPKCVDELSKQKYTMRPLRVGVYILPAKVKKLVDKGVFALPHRQDLELRPVDFNKSLWEQGPFDILLHKISSWFVDPTGKSIQQLQHFLQYIQSQQTNLHFTQNRENGLNTMIISNSIVSNDSGSSTEEEKTNENHSNHRMYVLDHPYAARGTADRWGLHQTIADADIPPIADKVGNKFKIESPPTVLVTSAEMADLSRHFQQMKINGTVKPKNCVKCDHTKHCPAHRHILEKISNMTYPVIAKARIGVSALTKNAVKDLDCNAHRIYCISKPNASSLLAQLDISEDWILQQYIPHSEECHKMYVCGQHVFATVNDSIPFPPPASDTIIPYHSRKLSKQPMTDQSSSLNLSDFYQQLSVELRRVSNLTCFGCDVVFGENKHTAYVLDINFLPSYKSVENFSSLFWGFVLDQYYQFMASDQ